MSGVPIPSFGHNSWEPAGHRAAETETLVDDGVEVRKIVRGCDGDLALSFELRADSGGEPVQHVWIED